MPLALFITTDGDVVLRAGSEPDSKHDFRVHKLILSLPVFKDMLTFPQPHNQTLNEPQLPIVNIMEPPEVIDTILRLVYPGVEPPKIAGISSMIDDDRRGRVYGPPRASGKPQICLFCLKRPEKPEYCKQGKASQAPIVEQGRFSESIRTRIPCKMLSLLGQAGKSTGKDKYHTK